MLKLPSDPLTYGNLFYKNLTVFAHMMLFSVHMNKACHNKANFILGPYHTEWDRFSMYQL